MSKKISQEIDKNEANQSGDSLSGLINRLDQKIH
jgi:hypothetical protein